MPKEDYMKKPKRIVAFRVDQDIFEKLQKYGKELGYDYGTHTKGAKAIIYQYFRG